MKLTKLEQFVANHKDMTFDDMATQLNRTPAAIERAYDRLQKKLRAEVRPTKEFVVAAVSSNTNSFGLHGCVLVAKDGEAWEVGRCQSSPPSAAWKRGQRVTFAVIPQTHNGKETPHFVGCEIPRRLPDAPPAVVKAVFAAVNAGLTIKQS